MYHVLGATINTWHQFLQEPPEIGIFNIPISQIKNRDQESWFVIELCLELKPIWLKSQTSNPLFWVLGPNSIVCVCVGEGVAERLPTYNKQFSGHQLGVLQHNSVLALSIQG